MRAKTCKTIVLSMYSGEQHSGEQLSQSGEPLSNDDVSARNRARAADRSQMQSVHEKAAETR